MGQRADVTTTQWNTSSSSLSCQM